MPKKGYVQTDAHRRALSKAKMGNINCLGYRHTDETRGKMAEWRRTDKTRRKMSKSHTGLKHSVETRRKMRKAQLGRRHSVETRRRISLSHVGMKLTDETKRKISESLIGKMKGDRHPNWRGGVSFLPYPLEWTRELKQYVLDRDGNSCVLCDNVFHEQNGVHHIDYDKENCDPMNLITACRSCNARVNVDREYWEDYFTGLLQTICHIMN